MKCFKNTFSQEKQIEILESFDWPIFPLMDTLYIIDKNHFFENETYPFQRNDRSKVTFYIERNDNQNSDVLKLDTVQEAKSHIFICFTNSNAKDSLYYFRFSRKTLNEDRDFQNIKSGVVERW